MAKFFTAQQIDIQVLEYPFVGKDFIIAITDIFFILPGVFCLLQSLYALHGHKILLENLETENQLPSGLFNQMKLSRHVNNFSKIQKLHVLCI